MYFGDGKNFPTVVCPCFRWNSFIFYTCWHARWIERSVPSYDNKRPRKLKTVKRFFEVNINMIIQLQALTVCFICCNVISESTNCPAAKPPKHSELGIDNIREKPVILQLSLTWAVGWHPQNNLCLLMFLFKSFSSCIPIIP